MASTAKLTLTNVTQFRVKTTGPVVKQLRAVTLVIVSLVTGEITANSTLTSARTMDVKGSKSVLISSMITGKWSYLSL